MSEPPLTSLTRRAALRVLAASASAAAISPQRARAGGADSRPNVLFVFSDQQQNRTWEKNQPLIKTPFMMQLAGEGTVVQNMISQSPVCTPYRGMLMSGQYPRTTGVIKNDDELKANGSRLSEITAALGYRNAYIGKWHLSGARVQSRGETVPLPYRHGFTGVWKGHEARHNYSSGIAWHDETDNAVALNKWRDFQEADEVVAFLDDHLANHSAEPFFCVWSMGPPHNPYVSNTNQTSPDPAKTSAEYYRELLNNPANRPPNYDPNGPVTLDVLAEYYALCTGTDAGFGQVLGHLDSRGLKDNTIVVYTSDHGDMLGAFGLQLKQKPWEEAINVPFIIRYPNVVPANSTSDMLIGALDLMPTLLGLMGQADAIPPDTEGINLSAKLCGQPDAMEREHLWIGFTDTSRSSNAAGPAAPYVGVRTKTHTYATFEKDNTRPGYGSAGGYVLYDNINDPFQQTNLVDQASSQSLQSDLWDKLVVLHTESHEGENFTLPDRPLPLPGGTYLKMK